MTSVRRAQTVWHLLNHNHPLPLRCPGAALQFAVPRPFTLQSQHPSGLLCASRIKPALPRRLIRHSSTDSAPPGASFVPNSSIPEKQDARDDTPATPSASPSGTSQEQQQQQQYQQQTYQQPSYELTFTCKPCGHRSTHVVTKQAYHFGTILIRCPGCKDRHAISDHLKIFNDKPTSFEDILAGKGQTVKKAIRMDEDTIEFLD